MEAATVYLGLNPAATPITSIMNYMTHADALKDEVEEATEDEEPSGGSDEAWWDQEPDKVA